MTRTSPAVDSPARLLSSLECSLALLARGHSHDAILARSRSVLADLATLRRLEPGERFRLEALCVEDCGRVRLPRRGTARRPARCAECALAHARRLATARQQRRRARLNQDAAPTSGPSCIHPRTQTGAAGAACSL